MKQMPCMGKEAANARKSERLRILGVCQASTLEVAVMIGCQNLLGGKRGLQESNAIRLSEHVETLNVGIWFVSHQLFRLRLIWSGPLSRSIVFRRVDKLSVWFMNLRTFCRS